MRMPWIKRTPPAPGLHGAPCPILMHDGNGRSVGACEHGVLDNVCVRHGRLRDYPSLNDFDVPLNQDRCFDADPGFERSDLRALQG